MVTFDHLLKAMKESNRGYDLALITRAYECAEQAHLNQRRDSGEPYIIHPIAVSMILVELGMDSETICASLMHDVVEDTSVTSEDLRKQFGPDVAALVDGVTKLTKITYSSREERQAENVRKMLLAMAKDVRVIIIKLADRLHNMRTLIHRKEEQKRRDTALETMEVYAPLAHRLGIRAIKEELEDISLKFLDPVGYQDIERLLELKQEQRQQFLDKIQEKIKVRFEKENMKVFLVGRVKSIYGIYRKVYTQGRNFDEIYDIYAVRVIVNTVFECYNVLGVMHDTFTPIPNRFKDYISTPKKNLYQSLHTTVLDKEGIPFEIQIRTWDMHYTAEYGIAAHWKYKAGIAGKDKLEERLAWVRQLLEAQQDSGDAMDIVRTIKSDIAPEECFVCTPKGDVKNLPTGSTVIDFAYAIHSEVGNHMIGAKVNSRIVPLDFKLETGMVVEVTTSNAIGKGPSRDWLKIVKTSEARTKIRSWFKKERREENIETGSAELEREFRRNLINVPEAELDEFLLAIAKKQHINTVEDFYAAIGYGGVLLSRIMPRIKDEFVRIYRSDDEEKEKEKKLLLSSKAKKPKKPTSGVIVEGLSDCLVKFSKCCNPLPGDDIIGFITRGYGVSIHKRDCANVVSADASTQGRWVRAEWAASTLQEKFKSTIDLLADSRDTLIADVSVALCNMHIPIHSMVAKELAQNERTAIQLTVEVNDLSQLNYLITSLKHIPGVDEIKRSIQ